METNLNTFEKLNNIDVSSKVKEKNKLTYLPWSSAWAEIKKVCPTAQFKIKPQIMGDNFNVRPWHDDGRTGWVEVSVIINDIECTETLPIMDYRNQAIPADKITSVDANKSIKRCLVKACALHGLGLYIYENEELPEEATKLLDLKEEIKTLINKKCSLSDKAKAKVKELCIKAETEYDPSLTEDAITGNPAYIENYEILSNLKKQLLAVRK